jgi:hypothetical protein
MVERHYGHLSDQYLRSQVAAHALSLDVDVDVDVNDLT